MLGEGIVNTRGLARCAAMAILAVTAPQVYADDDCDAPIARWQPLSAVQALAQRNHWQTHRLKIDDGCYEIKGVDGEGNRFKAKLDPATLEIVSMKRAKERHREHPGEPAGSAPRD